MKLEGMKTYKLSELIDLIGGGTPKTNVPEYWNGNIPWLSVVDFGKITKHVFFTEKKISEKGLKESSTKLLKKGYLIISARGTVGELAMLGKDMAFNQSCYGINAKGFTTNNYLFYLIKHNINQLKSKTHGAVFDTITKQTFDNIEVTIPLDLLEQSRIASILSSLDDKIELNLQMNKTLEAVAQAIFKEICSFKSDGLPIGWSISKLSDLADVCSSKRIFRDEYVETGIPFYRGKEITQLSKGEAITTELFISSDRYNTIKRTVGVPKVGDLLITSVGTIGSVWQVDNDMPFYFKDGNVTWISNFKSEVNGDFIYQWLQTKETIEQIKSVTIGSTQEALTISALKGLKILLPDKNTILSITKQLQSINSKRINNIKQNQNLINIRNTLLPRLMNGKIRVV